MSARRGVLAAALAASLLLAGCGGAELYSGLEEREANEMAAVIQSAGIDASKSSRDGQAWTISVPDGDLARAVEILHERGYPREQFDSLGGVFRREGFVSSPTEERARLLHALSQELSHTLASMDGVVMARVHLSVPEREPLADEQPVSSASVFIKHRPEIDLSAQIPQIKALVANGVEGLDYEHVSVMLAPSQPLAMVESEPAPRTMRWALSLAALAGAGALAFSAFRRRTAVRTRLLTRDVT